ncbi:MAG: hypothetical protein JXD21_03455 [Candidatus Omnitrophica bacterium]|nr:hypothetical protein [Candidatus Omnitrophota bacterium]
MDKKNVIFLSIVLILFSAGCVKGPDEAGEKFKVIAEGCFKDMMSSQIEPWNLKDHSEEEIAKDKERIQAIVKKTQEKLRQLVKEYPRSRWADDSQSLLAFLLLETPPQRMEALKYLIETYPHGRFEAWTEEKFGPLLIRVEGFPMEASARIDLVATYLMAGDIDKAEETRLALIKKYPKLKDQFSQSLLPPDINTQAGGCSNCVNCQGQSGTVPENEPGQPAASKSCGSCQEKAKMREATGIKE